MLQLKENVIIHGNKYTNAILEAVQLSYARRNANVIITSGNDSIHGPNSYHGQNRAIDIRFWQIPEGERKLVAHEIRELLPAYYDVVTESDHYHIESDAVKERACGALA